MAWIELHQAVWTHRKTFELAGLLDLDETYAASHVIRLWSWALDNAPDGDLSSLSGRAIAFGAGWRGDADTFVDALMQSGWLDEDRCIHDWQEYAGRLIERRQSNTERMRAARANRVERDESAQPPHVQRTTAARAGATVPDRTIPDLTVPDLKPQVPDALVVEVSGGAGGAADAANGADAPTTAAAKSQAEILRGLSDDARAVLDSHREAHGRRLLTKLTPESARVLENAVADLGLDRLQESIRYMAGKIPPVPDLSKAINAARTKRTNDATARAPNSYRNGQSALETRDASKYFETRTGTIPRR